MHLNRLHKRIQGMTLIEVLFAIGLLGLVFGALVVVFQVITTLIGGAKAQAGAVSLANRDMEYIRSLSYDNVGTKNGIPSGPIAQLGSTTLNGVKYSKRTLIEYVDAPQDGTGASDINGILADYKLVKVEYSWDDKGTTKTISLVSNVIPRGIETTAGGGTLTVNVFNAAVQPLSGAAVRVYNNSGTTTIDTTRYTNAAGVAMFSGAPALANYQITVNDTGYSTDQTYSASSSNPNPNPPHVAVLESEVSTMNFQIDQLSNLTVETLDLPTSGKFEDLFNSTSTIATSTGIAVASGVAKLQGSSGSYSPSGTLFSTSINPGTLAVWQTVLYQAAAPSNTGIVVRVYDKTGTTTPKLIPDSALPGNSAGFAPGSVDISSLNIATYRELALAAFLSSSDAAVTPTLTQWAITYTISQSAIASIPFKLTSSKTIGTNASAQPVYKYQKSLTTNGSGNIAVNNLEWGIYDVALNTGSYDIAEACRNIPYSLSPGVTDTLKLTLAPASADTFRVNVVDTDGNEVPNADVTLSRSGFTSTKSTSLCGQAFYNSGVSAAVDYTLDVHAFGYVDQSVTNISISGDDSLVVILTDS